MHYMADCPVCGLNLFAMELQPIPNGVTLKGRCACGVGLELTYDRAPGNPEPPPGEQTDAAKQLWRMIRLHDTGIGITALERIAKGESPAADIAAAALLGMGRAI